MGGILRLISASPDNLGAVLQSVAEQAAQICQAQYVDIFILEHDNLRNLAWFGEIHRTLAFPLDRSSVSGRSVCDVRPVSVDDMQNAGDEFARGREVARKGGQRSIVGVPLIREGRALGTIVVSRTEIRPFERKHIDLLTNFAAPRYMRWHAHMRRPGSDERAAVLPNGNGNGASHDPLPPADEDDRI